MDKLLYLKARDAGFTSREVHGHHPESLKLYEFLAIHDVMDYNDFFEWKMGGEGDNGEILLFQLDAYFAFLDHQRMVEES